ncbi:MAG: hypothetical protein ACFFGZ_17630, partial [Candidatus Thorarchaeota archaeon]
NSSANFESLLVGITIIPFRWKLDSNDRLQIAFVSPTVDSDLGILSIYQQMHTGNWIRNDIDTDHLIMRYYEGEGEAHFTMEMLDDSPVLVYASSPTKDELDKINVAQEDVCSLYIAQDKNNTLFTDFKPARIDLSSEEESLLEIIDIWLLIPAIGLLAIVAIALGVFLRKAMQQKR